MRGVRKPEWWAGFAGWPSMGSKSRWCRQRLREAGFDGLAGDFASHGGVVIFDFEGAEADFADVDAVLGVLFCRTLYNEGRRRNS